MPEFAKMFLKVTVDGDNRVLQAEQMGTCQSEMGTHSDIFIYLHYDQKYAGNSNRFGYSRAKIATANRLMPILSATSLATFGTGLYPLCGLIASHVLICLADPFAAMPR